MASPQNEPASDNAKQQVGQKRGRQGGRQARLARQKTGGLSDKTLIEKGLANYTRPPTPEKVCVIACGALVHEIMDIIRFNAFEHIAVTCLPAILHNEPSKIVPAMEKAIHAARVAGFGHVFCGYADCGTGGELDRLLTRENVSRLPGAHCYQFFSGSEAFAANSERDMRAFYLTDFLARHFDGLTWRPLGLDRHPELLADYFGAYEKLVFLSQTDDADLLARAKNIAKRLGLDFDHRKTGYGDLSRALHVLPK